MGRNGERACIHSAVNHLGADAIAFLSHTADLIGGYRSCSSKLAAGIAGTDTEAGNHGVGLCLDIHISLGLDPRILHQSCIIVTDFVPDKGYTRIIAAGLADTGNGDNTGRWEPSIAILTDYLFADNLTACIVQFIL